MNMHNGYNYQEAFSRTLGWITPLEQMQLRHKRIAIAGAGGVGGAHLLALTRLGIGCFNIADLDTFEIANFNRQAGAMMSTIGKTKVNVMAAMACDINPELNLRSFHDGINASNVDDFLRDVDLYVDALDFFAFEAREAVFAACARLNIPAITVAPLGMGAALVNFIPGQMSFEQYFGFYLQSDTNKAIRFLVGLAPKAPHRHYLVEPERMDPEKQRGPSTPMAVQLCAGVAGTEALKILLNRGKVLAAPHSVTYDAFLNRHIHCWRPGGHRNPFMRLRVWLVSRILQHQLSTKKKWAPEESAQHKSILSCILDQARWAPSGDNEQPWQFEVTSETSLTVHFLKNHTANIYDYDGRPSLTSLGCLTENLRLAGCQFGWTMHWHYEPHTQGGLLHVDFDISAQQPADSLYDFIQTRSVDRRPYRMLTLTNAQKRALEQAVGDEFKIYWLENTSARWQASCLNASATQIRLGLPETIEQHRRILDWDNDYSIDGIPIKAVGISTVTQHIMRWVMNKQKRAKFILGTLPGSTWGAQLEMDFIPGMQCAAHFFMVRNIPERQNDSTASIRAGIALQRYWLTATKMGLALQPSIATLGFSYYGRHQIPFSQNISALPRAQKLGLRFDRQCKNVGTSSDQVVFMGRIGTPIAEQIKSRSIRKAVANLTTQK